ncbi:hypothetical protein, partial [Pseudomonas lurida]|uniref:hypothetical protein n=1 Tax=Pseudomonas lurida TaxID=244566 RepID=UPI0030DD4D6C
MILIACWFLRLVQVEGTVIIWSEIMENRRKPASLAATLDINCDCKEYVLDYLAHSFPVQLYEPFSDGEGNMSSRPVFRDGQPVESREAVARRT